MLRRLILLLALWLPLSVFAGLAGEVTHISGTLSVKHQDGTTGLLAVKSPVLEGDVLKTEAQTYARIKFIDSGEVVMRPNSQIKTAAYIYTPDKPQEDRVLIGLLKGGMRAVTGLAGKRDHDKVKFETVTATIGIRGTHFGALLCHEDCDDVVTITGRPPSDGLHVDVASGAVEVSNLAGRQEIGTGQFGYVADAQHAPRLVPPEEGIRVTMPTAISRNETHGQGIGQAKDSACSIGQ